METFKIGGGIPLKGKVRVNGAKNVALKMLIASLLTDDELVIHNVPKLRDVEALIEVLSYLGVSPGWEGNTLVIKHTKMKELKVPLDVGARLRTSSMVLGPLLARYGTGIVPNPGGCRLGARPIDRHIEGLRTMGAVIDYNSGDGFFYAKAEKLHGATIRFSKNTHTGTESIILAAVLAQGRTVIENAAQEIEVDDLIACLNQMGASIKRENNPRTIVIDGVKKLGGTSFTIMPDRNEEVTFAIAAALTNGEIIVENSQTQYLTAFLEAFTKAGGKYEKINDTSTKYNRGEKLKAIDIVTNIYPGFMTDWQAPWAILMTAAQGISTIHETVFESRFSYVAELKKMGAKIEFYDPLVARPDEFYNFNKEDTLEGYHQGIRITGPTPLHNAVVVADDIRAGAGVVLAALVAHGESFIRDAENIDRGYEQIEIRLAHLGANITRIKEEV